MRGGVPQYGGWCSDRQISLNFLVFPGDVFHWPDLCQVFILDFPLHLNEAKLCEIFGSLYSCLLWHFPPLDFIALVPTHSSVCFLSAKSVLLCPESRQTKCLISRTLPSPKRDPVNCTYETYSVVGAYKKERSGGGGGGEDGAHLPRCSSQSSQSSLSLPLYLCAFASVPWLLFCMSGICSPKPFSCSSWPVYLNGAFLDLPTLKTRGTLSFLPSLRFEGPYLSTRILHLLKLSKASDRHL